MIARFCKLRRRLALLILLLSLAAIAAAILLAENNLTRVVLNLAQALELRKQGGSWVGPVVLAALTVVAGLFLVFFSFGAMKAAVMVIGGVIVYNGVSNLLIESKYRRAGR